MLYGELFGPTYCITFKQGVAQNEFVITELNSISSRMQYSNFGFPGCDIILPF